jgi:hypothetical protein
MAALFWYSSHNEARALPVRRRLDHRASLAIVLLINLLPLENAQSDTPEEPHRTVEEINQWFRDHIGLTGKTKAGMGTFTFDLA